MLAENKLRNINEITLKLIEDASVLRKLSKRDLIIQCGKEIMLASFLCMNGHANTNQNLHYVKNAGKFHHTILLI